MQETNKPYTISNKLIYFIIACTLFTDYKVGEIKLGEIILLGVLLTYPLFFQKMQKIYFIIILFFCVLVAFSILQSSRIEFYYPEDISFLKKPYIYPFSKFIEIILGVVFAAIVHEKLKNVSKATLNGYIHRLAKYIFTVFYGLTFVWLLVRVGILKAQNSIFVQSGDFRLKGFFVEGGPFGLFMAVMLILQFYSGKEKFTRLFFFNAFAVFMTTASKSGLLFMFVFFSWYLVNKYYQQHKFFILALSFIILALGTWTTYKYSAGYLEALKNTEVKAKGPSKNDGAFAMGRIPAMTQIIPNIVKKDWELGVGMFNYPFIRDNPVYCGYWEKAPAFGDSPGLGFLVEILYGSGITGLTLYLILLVAIWKRKIHGPQALVFYTLFILLNLAGVSLTFTYPWLLLSFALLYSKFYTTQHEETGY